MDIKNFIAGKNIVFIFALVVLAFVIYQVRDIVLLFFASFVIASALNPAVDKMSTKIPRGLSVTIIYLLGFIIMGLFFIPLINILIHQTALFLSQLPAYWTEVFDFLNKSALADKVTNILPSFPQIFSTVSSYSANFVNESINITMNLIGGLIIAFTLAMIVLYMLLDKKELKQTYIRFFPPHLREKAENISVNISKKVGGYVMGQILSMVIVAVLTGLGLLLIGVNFAVLLGIIAGVLDIIPVVGPILAGAIAILVALAQKPILAVWALIVFLLVQWVTNTFFRAIIFGRFLDLHPLIIIFALLASASTLGIFGVILSPAIAATLCVLIEELYLKRIESDT